MSDDDQSDIPPKGDDQRILAPPMFVENAFDRLVATSQRVTELLSYLRSHVGSVVSIPPGAPPVDGDWVKCDELTSHGAWLKSVIVSSGETLGTSDETVAASLFVQNYAYRVFTLGVAYALSSGVLPDLSAGAMAISLRSGRPANVAFTSSTALVLGSNAHRVDHVLADVSVRREMIDFLLDRAIDQHLALLVDAVRSQFRVGQRLLWGNIASSAAMAFRTMEGILGTWVRPLGEQLFELAPAQLTGLGSFLSLEVSGNRGWYWERTNCCLHDQLQSGIRCSDCSLTPSEERRCQYLNELKRPQP